MSTISTIETPRQRELPAGQLRDDLRRRRRPTNLSREALAKFNEPLPLPKPQLELSADDLPF